jgi:hypothetical protein
MSFGADNHSRYEWSSAAQEPAVHSLQRWYSLSFRMNFAKLNCCIPLLALAMLSACGSPGAPLPPSLELARPVADLRAIRKGNTVTLRWTAPRNTTDGHNMRHLGATNVCRSSQSMQDCGVPVASLLPPKTRPNETPGSSARTYTDTLTNLSPRADARYVYAVSVLNSYGKAAGLSNRVEVPAVPTLPPPKGLQSQLSGEGVRLSWKAPDEVPNIAGLRFVFRIYRRETSGTAQVIAGEVPVSSSAAPSFLDSNIEWEKTYNYRVEVVTLISEAQGTGLQVEGDDTPEATVFAHDVFPPAVPTGLQAVFSGPGQKGFIDLVWAPDTDADLAGYNVYRTEAGAEPMKLTAQLAKSPTFRDEAVLAGHEYTYSVSAIDVRGNESERSQPASERVPEQ